MKPLIFNFNYYHYHKVLLKYLNEIVDVIKDRKDIKIIRLVNCHKTESEQCPILC